MPAKPSAPRTDSELSEFLLRACHDLRGPLRSVRIYADLLAKKRDGDGPGVEQSLSFMSNGAITAGAMVDGLSDYALALGIDASRFQPTPLDVIVRLAIAKLAAPIRESDAKVSYGELPSVTGDADRLLLLFEYLLDHALRRRGENPLHVSIAAEAQDGGWLFTVRDTGSAVAAESLEKAFTPFARLHGNQRPGPGLATCRVIVERHGGNIWVEAGGCEIRFTLPEAPLG